MVKKTHTSERTETAGHGSLAAKMDVLATLVSAQCGLLTEQGVDWEELQARAEKITAGGQPAQAAQEPAEA